MKSIKQTVKVIALIGISSTLAATSAFAQAGPVITVDELGKGTFNGNPLISGIGVDPMSGISTLFYRLPFAGTPGDVVLLEPGPIPQQTSDILRFDGQGTLYFFSERETTDVPPFDPADVAQLPSLNTASQPVFLQEVGPEGNNGAFYTPNPGDPGFVPGTTGLSYNFISDVPEPSSGLLTMLGGGLLLAFRSRRQNQRN
jgi:hypothetical protein